MEKVWILTTSNMHTRADTFLGVFASQERAKAAAQMRESGMVTWDEIDNLRITSRANCNRWYDILEREIL